MNIRKYRVSDRDQLIKLWQAVFPEDPLHNEPGSVIDAKLKVDDLIFIAEVGDEIIGACMAGYDGHRGWLYAVAVKTEHRRGKIGKHLVNSTLLALKDLGCVKVNLQVRADNAQVAAFYQSLGFDVEDRLSMGLLFRKQGD